MANSMMCVRNAKNVAAVAAGGGMQTQGVALPLRARTADIRYISPSAMDEAALTAAKGGGVTPAAEIEGAAVGAGRGLTLSPAGTDGTAVGGVTPTVKSVTTAGEGVEGSRGSPPSAASEEPEGSLSPVPMVTEWARGSPLPTPAQSGPACAAMFNGPACAAAVTHLPGIWNSASPLDPYINEKKENSTLPNTKS
jgi:hypothetical protein